MIHPLLSDPIIIWTFVVPPVIILLDMLTGVFVRVSKFQTRKITDFLVADLLKYAGCLLCVFLVWSIHENIWEAVVTSAIIMGILSLSLITSVPGHIRAVMRIRDFQDIARRDTLPLPAVSLFTEELPSVRAARFSAQLETEQMSSFTGTYHDETTSLALPKMPYQKRCYLTGNPQR